MFSFLFFAQNVFVLVCRKKHDSCDLNLLYDFILWQKHSLNNFTLALRSSYKYFDLIYPSSLSASAFIYGSYDSNILTLILYLSSNRWNLAHQKKELEN